MFLCLMTVKPEVTRLTQRNTFTEKIVEICKKCATRCVFYRILINLPDLKGKAKLAKLSPYNNEIIIYNNNTAIFEMKCC